MSQPDQEWLRHWERLIDEPPGTWTDEDSAGMALNELRRDRTLAIEAFKPFPQHDALLRRFFEILDWSGENDSNRMFYLLNHNPRPASDKRLIELVRTYIKLGSKILDQAETKARIIVVRQANAVDEFLDDFKRGKWDTLHMPLADWFCDDVLPMVDTELEEAADFLTEPLYLLACNYDLAYYVIWGLVEDRFEFDPFRPLVELWRHKANAAYSQPERTIYIYAPEETAS